MEYRNPVYNEHGTIDCEINHPQWGWIPFHAAPDDIEDHGRELFAEIEAAGDVAPYVPLPEPEQVPTLEDQINELKARVAALENRT